MISVGDCQRFRIAATLPPHRSAIARNFGPRRARSIQNVGRNHPGVGEIRGRAHLRRHPGARPGVLQGRAARHARLRGRRPPGRRDPPDRGAGVGAGAIQREQRDRRRPPVARRRHHAQRLSRSPPSRCATPTAPRSRTSRRKWCRPRSAIAERDGALRPRPAGRARRRLRGDDPDRRRHATIRRSAPAAGTGPACSARSAPPPRSGGCAASTPTPWRARSGSPAARPPAPSRRGARPRSNSTSAAARCRG